MKKKVLSLALAFVMALALLPGAALAAEEDGPVIIPLPEEITGMLTEATYPQFYKGLLRVYTGGEYSMWDDSANAALRYGFVDKTGKIVIPMEYEYAGFEFRGDMATVRKDGKYGVIDTTGKMVFECEEGWNISSFSGKAAPVGLYVGDNYKYGLVNKAGKMILPAEYDNVRELSEDGKAEGLFAITKRDENWKSLYGVADDSGKVLIPTEYEDINFAGADRIWVRENDKWGLCDINGKELMATKYDNGYADFSEGMCIVSVDGKYGYVNTAGKEVIPCKYDEARIFSEGLAAVRSSGKWGYINTEGKEVISCQYDEVGNFSEGQARVRIGDWKTGTWSSIDAEGNQVAGKASVKLQDYDAEYDGEFTDGLAAWSMSDWGYGEKILIDETGKTVVPKGYKEGNGGSAVSPEMYADGLAVLTKETGELNQWGNKIDAYGVVDRNGGVVIPFGEYDWIYPVAEGACAAVKDDKYYIIDFNGMTLPLANPTQTLADLVEEPEIALPETGDAKENVQAVQVDGKDISFAMYSPDNGGTNYVRLVDLAVALKGTAGQFNVGYDEALDRVTLTAGKAYEGPAAAAPFHSKMAYTALVTPTYVDGVAKSLEAIRFEYNNGGYTYYKLRDLGEALGFNVGWDNDSQRIYIESDKAYDPNN